MTVETKIDYKKNEVKVVGEPRFSIKELAMIERLPDGRIKTRTGEGKFFNLVEWNAIYKAGGDFSLIGVEIDPSEVAMFTDYEKLMRRHHTPVSLLPDKDDVGRKGQDGSR